MPVQIGENFNGPEAMIEALAARACDYVMPDVSRIGGVPEQSVTKLLQRNASRHKAAHTGFKPVYFTENKSPFDPKVTKGNKRGMETKAARGPIETIKSKGVKIPLYDAGDGRVIIAFYVEGKRKLVKCKSVETAREEAKAKIQELTTGVAHAGTFSPRQTALINDATAILRELGNVSLSQAVREYSEAFKILDRQPLIVEAAQHYSDFLKRQKTLHTPMKFPAVVDEFLWTIIAQGRSARYVEDCTSRLSRAAKAFRGFIQRITTPDLEAWLDSIHVAGRTRNNYRATLCTLFSFARCRGYLPRDQRTEAELCMKASDRGGTSASTGQKNFPPR